MNHIRPRGEKPTQYEVEAARRYSFDSPDIHRKDKVSKHPGSSVRIVSCERPSEITEHYRDALQERGLILGRRIESDSYNTDAYHIPPSARPLQHDSGEQAPGTYSYNDQRLFYNIGALLAEVTRALPGKMIEGELPKEIALVEFTLPNERKLFLAPGIEHRIVDAPEETEEIDLIEKYTEQMWSLLTVNKEERLQSLQHGFIETLSLS